LNRRNFLRGSTLLGAGLGTGMLASRVASTQHEHHQQRSQPQKQKVAPPKAPPQPETAPKMKQPPSEPAVVPVETPDIPKLPWTMEDGVKVFHLTAEVVKREFLPASAMGSARVADVWGFNGSMPGPTIEVNEGDRVRIILHNNLPEGITIHWHGVEAPIEMDGTPFISQPIVEPCGMYTYEFTIRQNGTFFYHSHMAMQEMMGLIGLFIMHPKTPHEPRVDKDFGLILQEWAILPNNSVPNSMAMEFNWLTINGKAGPATTPMIVKLGERVRIRMVNLGMDHHPMHIHGTQFYVTGTEGGRVPETAWFPNNTVLVGVAQARDIEFNAVNPGDWMLHCHLPHHMMNQMVSMVGPVATAGQGAQTGKGMEEGMGIIRDSNALSRDLAPGLGRGLGPTVDRERQLSNMVGQQQPPQGAQPHTGHSPTSAPQGGHQHGAMTVDEAERRRVPGYPQDMAMVMDEAVAKPETYGLAPGWSGAVVGMMTLVRVLPSDKYEEVMAKVREGRREKPPQAQPIHQHGG
jgi:FtsP/CotA-like multicopper oxidase with cupredoxin domain